MNLCYVIKLPSTVYILYAIVNFLVLVFPIVMQDKTLGGNGLKVREDFSVLCLQFPVNLPLFQN